MNNIFLGKVVNTHGVKGEIRILSDFEYKEKAFKVHNILIIDNIPYKILSYRVHKNFDMVTLEGINSLDDALLLKGNNVFIKRDDIHLNSDEYLLFDLLNLKVMIDNECYGSVKDYDNSKNPLLIIDYQNKIYYIPIKGNYILNVDLVNKCLFVDSKVKELIL